MRLIVKLEGRSGACHLAFGSLAAHSPPTIQKLLAGRQSLLGHAVAPLRRRLPERR